MPSSIVLLTAAVAVITLSVITLSDRRALFWMAFVAPFVPIAYLDRYHFHLPAGVKWLPFLCIVFAALAASVLLPRIRAQLPRSLVLAYGGLLLVCGASLLLNDTKLASFVVAQRGYIVLFSAIIALKAAYGIYSRERLHAFLVGAGLLSCLVCFAQRILVVPITAGPDPGDRVTGLFSVGSITLFFHLVCIGIVLAYWSRGRRVVPWHCGLVLLVFVLAMGVGNQKAALPYLVALLGFLLLRSGVLQRARVRGRAVLASLALPAVMLFVFTPIYNQQYADQNDASYAHLIMNRSYLERYLFGNEDVQFTSEGRLLRGQAILFAWELSSRDSSHALLGLGPGATSESRVAGASGPLTRRYPTYSIDRTALSMMIADTGLLGVTMHVAFLGAVFFWRPRGRRLEPHEHRLVRELLVFLSLAYFVYGNLYYEPIYALLTAIVIYPLGAGASRDSGGSLAERGVR